MTSGDIGRLLWVSKGQQSLSRFQAHSAGPKASGCHCFLLFLPILHLPSPNPRPWACLEGPRPPLSRSLQGQAEPHPKGQVWRLLTCPAALARPGLHVGGAGPAASSSTADGSSKLHFPSVACGRPGLQTPEGTNRKAR